MGVRILRYISSVLLLGTVWAAAQTLPARRSDNYDPNTQDGRFDLRARVDGAVEFRIRGAEITYRLRNGRAPRDEGSEYKHELPLGALIGLHLEQRDGRNPIRILEEPSQRNNWTLVLLIEDPQGGDSRYHARITWTGYNAASPYGDRPRDRDREGERDDRDRGRLERSPYDRGVQLGSDDVRRGLSRDYRRHRGEYDDRTEKLFRDGYDQGYKSGTRDTGGDQQAYEDGRRFGQRDARDQLRPDYKRYSERYTTRTEADFRRGYSDGYNGR
jgi:hypothetical protein